MKTDDNHQLTHLTQAVLKSRKYRHVSQDFVQSMVEREMRVRPNAKAAIKAVKNKLHQVAGAYFAGSVRYDAWLGQLSAAAQSDDEAAWRAACWEVMEQHTSAKERLPILDHFYQTVLADLSPVESVLDLACGLNPLALAWMPLAADARYYACDIYSDMIAFLNQFFSLAEVTGQATVCNLLSIVPQERVEVALLLKMLPPLEQIDKAASLTLLQAIQADYLLVSFPAQSLGGRQKGMVETYEARFRELISGESWPVQRFSFETELAFLVHKSG